MKNLRIMKEKEEKDSAFVNLRLFPLIFTRMFVSLQTQQKNFSNPSQIYLIINTEASYGYQISNSYI